jgi:dolichol-phosphate mannosyltransferase
MRTLSFLSVVVPLYNEEQVIPELIKRMTSLETTLRNIRLEVIFVDDGSIDRTLSILKEMTKQKKYYKVVKLSRNFGHQAAALSGLVKTSGEAAVLMDADLQDPPELILDLVQKWEMGFDVVVAKRIERRGETYFKKLSASLFYRVLTWFSSVPIDRDVGDFRLVDRKLIQILRKMPENDLFLRGIFSWMGFSKAVVNYARDERYAGTTKYPLRKMLKFAVDGVLSFSTKPLRMAMWLGLISSCTALLGIFYVIWVRVFTDEWVAGWAGIMISILFMGGIQLISLGVIGEYVGRIYMQSKKRPRFIAENEYTASDD